jgi:hypothetical protein
MGPGSRKIPFYFHRLKGIMVAIMGQELKLTCLVFTVKSITLI